MLTDAERAKDISIKMSVTVSDGSFDASVTMPVCATKEQLNGFVEAWLKMFGAAVAQCVPGENEKVKP